MLRSVAHLSESDLELRLLRKGVVARSCDGESCADCGRRPLIGEIVHHFGADAVCELCRPPRRRAPDTSELVRHVEHGVSVRALPRAA